MRQLQGTAVRRATTKYLGKGESGHPSNVQRLGLGSVRAENLVHGSDQQDCSLAVRP
jgi:hypothetical protein